MSQYPTTRISLLMRVRNHEDHQAWSDFVTLYRPVLYRFGRRRGLQPADSQDLAQSVLAAVAEKIGDWNPDENRARFRTWLSRVALNQAITMYRRNQANRSTQGVGGSGILTQLNQHADSTETHSEELLAEYQREVFRHAARKVRQEFEESTWQAFWLTSVDGVSVSDAAQSLGRSIGSVYTARSRVIGRIQQVVQQIQADDDTLSPSSLIPGDTQ
ncbi:MAG: RNA polymerase sigma factor [Rubripirellula sp.]